MENFINHEYIYKLLEDGKKATKEDIIQILEKAKNKQGVSHEDVAALIQVEDKELLKKIFEVAGEIKESIYGNRVVVFAPLYISDYCVNNCVYCGYHKCHDFKRRRLTQEEIAEEVSNILQRQIRRSKIANKYECGNNNNGLSIRRKLQGIVSKNKRCRCINK